VKSWEYVAVAMILLAVWWYVDQNGSSSGIGGSFIDVWAQAIATAENVNPDYNNPGGLNMVGDAGSTPATGGGVIGLFSSFQGGYTALTNTLNNFVAKYGNDTLLNATAIYILGPTGAANSAGNYPPNVTNYANSIAAKLGVSTDTTLSTLAGQ